MINCPYCGKLTDPQLDSCVHCGGFLKKQSARPQRKSSAASQTCPSCSALVRDGDIICVACGTNLLTGQKIADERKKAVATEGRNPTTLVISVVAAVVIILLGILAIVYLTRDPVARAQKLDAAGRTTEAISILSAHVQEKPGDSRAQLALGRLYYGMGNFQPAAQAFQAALDADPSSREAGLKSVLSYAELGGDANRTAQIAVLQQMIQNDPGDAEAHHLLGLARGTVGDYPGQVEALRAAANHAPNDPDVEAALGVALALDKQYPSAVQELTAALGQDPGNGDVLAALGHLSGLRGNGAEAAEQLRSAVNQGTAMENQALTRLGLWALEDGKVPEARVFLGQALENGANDPVTRYFHAVCLAQQGPGAGAIQAFDELSRTADPFAAKAAVQLARLHLGNQEPDKALEALNRISVTPTGTACAELETVRARVYAALGEIGTAQDALRAAGKCDPDYAPLHLENGLLQVQRGNLPEGIRELERYLALVDVEDPASGAAEVRGLIDQLKQSAQSESPAASTAATPVRQGGIS
jgi:tetratricopeptide (TPR) repeat protein